MTDTIPTFADMGGNHTKTWAVKENSQSCGQCEKQKEPFDKKMSEVYWWYLKFTSIGGLTQAGGTEIRVNHLIWLVLTLCGGGLTIWNVYKVVEDYLSNDIVTKVTNVNVDSVEFPAVTLCPYNKVSCNALDAYLRECYASSSDKCPLEVRANLCFIYFLGRCPDTINIYSTIFYGDFTYEPMCMDNDTYAGAFANVSSGQEAQIVLGLLYNQLRDKDKLAIAHQPSTMIKECRYRGITSDSCYALSEGVVPFLSPVHGVCHTFNYFPSGHKNNFTVEKSQLSGEIYGLTMVINVDAVNYMMRGIAQNEGIKVLLHDPHETPNTATEGIMVHAGTLTNLALERIKLKREVEPFPSNCTDSWPEDYRELLKDYPYTQKLCQSICLDYQVRETCGCSYIDILEIDLKLSPMCDNSNATHAECMVGLNNMFHNSKDSVCRCQPQCEEIRYRVSHSLAKWPSSFFWPAVAEQYQIKYQNQSINENALLNQFSGSMSAEELNVMISVMNNIEDIIKNNFLTLNVYFETMVQVEVIEYPKYDADSLLSSLGGAFSLYLGITLISLFESLELIVVCFKVIWYKKKNKRMPQ